MKKNLVRAAFSIFMLIFLTKSAFPQWVQTNWQEGNNYFNLSAGENVVFARIWDSNNGGRMFFSDDEGVNWALSGSAGSDIDILSMIMLNNEVLAGTWEGFYHSRLDDISWKLLMPSGIPYDTSICSLAAIDEILFAGSTGGIYQSINDVNNWTAASTGIPANARVLSIISNGEALFAGTDNSGIFISTDGGITWAAINTGLGNLQISQLASMGTKVFAITLKKGVFVSDINDSDLQGNINNIKWTADNSGLKNINCFLTSYDLLFAGTDSNGVYLSSDSGQTWIEVNYGLPENTRIWSLAENDNNIFAGTGEGIWKVNPADINNYTITASATEGGTISPEGDVTVYETDSRTFTITPTLGYRLDDVVVDGNSVGKVYSYTFSNVTENHTIAVNFIAVPIYTITSSAGDGGTISPSGEKMFSEGWSQEYTMTPKPGFGVSSVIVDGNSVGNASTYTFDNITKDHTISVTFEVAPYQITATAGAGGTISPSGIVEVESGLSQKFTIAPSAGYEISDVVIDGVSVGAITSYTFSSVDYDHTITVSFSSLIKYQINCGGSQALPFAADQFYNTEDTYSVSNSIDTSGATNPAPQEVYQSERWGNMTYTIPNLVSETPYKVRLHFAEIYFSYSGGRIFNVAINGTTVLSNYDVYADSKGQYKAVVKEFIAAANESGEIVINFISLIDNAKISGIEIIKQ